MFRKKVVNISVISFGFYSLSLCICTFALDGYDGGKLVVTRLYHLHLTDTELAFSFSRTLGRRELRFNIRTFSLECSFCFIAYVFIALVPKTQPTEPSGLCQSMQNDSFPGFFLVEIDVFQSILKYKLKVALIFNILYSKLFTLKRKGICLWERDCCIQTF